MHSLKNRSVLCLKIQKYIKSFSANGLCFLVRGVSRCAQGKTSQSRVEEQQTQPTNWEESGVEPRPHWWKASMVWIFIQLGCHNYSLQPITSGVLRDLYYTESYFSYILITNFHPQFISLLPSLLLTLTYSSSIRIFLNYVIQ